MLIGAGTVPITGLPLTKGGVEFEEGVLTVGNQRFTVTQGVATMVAAAAVSCDALGLTNPYAVVAGDIGKGDGSQAIYDALKHDIRALHPDVIVMHYLQPSIKDMRDVVEALANDADRLVLIADAGSMYVAKAAGVAQQFDLFTPDPGEMAFLADPDALHPAYVRHFFFEVDSSKIPNLIRQAYECGNASKVLLVKGSVDYIAREGVVLARIKEPAIPAMEAIGGTGDTLTGIVSALVYAKYDLVDAATYAARINRVAGKLLHPTAATQVSDLISYIPTAIKMVL